MRLRAGEPRDLPAIAAILNAEIRSGTASWTETPKTIEDMIRWMGLRHAARHPVVVAEDADRLLGYATYGPFRAGEGYHLTVEHTVYVAAGARRRGIARALMVRLIDQAREAGLHRMIGGVSADQPASIALHHALGFVEAGRLGQVGRKNGCWLDLVLMVLELDAVPAGR